MNMLSQMAVLLILAVIAFALIKFLSEGQTIKDPPGDPPGGSGDTLLPPMLYVDQLDPRTMKLVKRFDLERIPDKGVSISRPNAKQGGIKLDDSIREAFTVSADHCRIGMDDKGIFLQDMRKDGRMYLPKTGKVVDQVDVVDGLVVVVGRQPLRFVIPNLWNMDSAESEDTVMFEEHSAWSHDGEAVFRRRTR